MDKWDDLYIFIVLKYVKKNEPTLDEFQNYVNVMLYGFEMEMENYENTFRDKKMITSGDDDTLILTDFGEMILNDIQSKRRKDTAKFWVPIIALAITTGAFVYSIVQGF